MDLVRVGRDADQLLGELAQAATTRTGATDLSEI
jgi:hypothetical protein